MSRQKKLVNKTNIPEYALARFARCLYPQMVADFLNENIQREFAEWQAEQHIPHSGDRTRFNQGVAVVKPTASNMPPDGAPRSESKY